MIDKNLMHFIGRHLTLEGMEYFSYSGCGFIFKVKANKNCIIQTTLISHLREDKEYQFIDVYINDEICKSICIKEEEKTFSFNVPDNKTSIVRIIKSNAGYISNIYLKDIAIINGEQIPYHHPKRPLMEFYGDSITCGYGNMGKQIQAYTPETEVFEKTYAYLASFHLNMDYSVVAKSGISLALFKYFDKPFIDAYNTVDIVYDYHADYKVDYAVINIGTNDGARFYELPLKQHKKALSKFYSAYKQLVDLIIKNNKGVKLVICYNAGACPEEINQEIINIHSYIKENFPNKVELLKLFVEQNGANYHPSYKAHEEYAYLLEEAIKKLN